MDHEAERVALVEAYRALLAEGLIVGKAGNVSVRIADGLLVTPSAVPAAEITCARATGPAPAATPTCLHPRTRASSVAHPSRVVSLLDSWATAYRSMVLATSILLPCRLPLACLGNPI